MSVHGGTVEIRDHRPLAPGSISLPYGYTIEDYVEELNSRVFLWAGTTFQPVRAGQRHIARYATEGKVYVLRVPLAGLLSKNPDALLEVTFCNSGAARHNKGRLAHRGPTTFVTPSQAARSPIDVVELTFRGQIALPLDTTFAENLKGPWALLLSTD